MRYYCTKLCLEVIKKPFFSLSRTLSFFTNKNAWNKILHEGVVFLSLRPLILWSFPDPLCLAVQRQRVLAVPTFCSVKWNRREMRQSYISKNVPLQMQHFIWKESCKHGWGFVQWNIYCSLFEFFPSFLSACAQFSAPAHCDIMTLQ